MPSRVRWWHLLIVYVVVVYLTSLFSDAGTAGAVALGLFVGWYMGYLHGAGALTR